VQIKQRSDTIYIFLRGSDDLEWHVIHFPFKIILPSLRFGSKSKSHSHREVLEVWDERFQYAPVVLRLFGWDVVEY
ncbi:MAG TPA: hypothetical protein VEH56_06450, partial [Candidatus Saccharimonadales bacterium]|nr:hypothetical protein [Candidatus Saccharimonadales bacterium]